MNKPGRNDPCPCGSSIKYKKCCFKSLEIKKLSPLEESEKTNSKALKWLRYRHYPAFFWAIKQRILKAIDAAHFKELLKDKSMSPIVYSNIMEWLLAEGSIIVKNQMQPVAQFLLESPSLKLTDCQTQWIEQLTAAPLRLYEVIDVVPGERLLLRDVIFSENAPLWVREKLASPEMGKYNLLGVRVLQVDGQNVTSGALYFYSRDYGFKFIFEVKQALEAIASDSLKAKEILSDKIIDHWFQYLTESNGAPESIDFWTFDHRMWVTDHYQVTDWQTLESILSKSENMYGSREAGWFYHFSEHKAPEYTKIHIRPFKRSNQIKITYPSQRHADLGRPWLEEKIGEFIQFNLRHRSFEKPSKTSDPALTKTLTKENYVEMMEHIIREEYARWVDTPQSILNNRPPSEAVKTAEGLEKMKYILHSYEYNENIRAQKQNRPEISFDFLWQGLGVDL